MPASRSSSELNVNVPSRLLVGSCVLALYCTSVLSLMRCLFASSNHDNEFCSVALVERDDELSPWLPPNVRFCTPLWPSVNVDVTRTRPDGRSRYGSP